jgi:hypothetical protein
MDAPTGSAETDAPTAPSRRRRGGNDGPELVTIYWRDIPAQVNAQLGRTREQRLLDGRFQRAIDRAAMVADIVTAQDYTAQWRRESQPCGEDLLAEAMTAAERLDTEFTKERLRRIVNGGGFEPGGTS